MKVVVFGASGNLGTALLNALTERAADLEIVAVARRAPDDSQQKTTGSVTWKQADIATSPLVPICSGADAVVQLAWLFHPAHHPQRTWEANVLGSTRVLDAIVRADVGSVVWSSSVGAYSPGLDHGLVDESWPTHGASEAPYVREKSYVERLLDEFALREPHRRLVRLRPAFVFHRRAAVQQRRLFAGPLLPAKLVGSRRIPVLPYPSGLVLQAVHADDVGAGLAEAVLGSARGSFNLCADDLVDQQAFGRIAGARTIAVPPGFLLPALRSAFHAHLVPAAPALFEALLHLPMMANAAARRELHWTPRWTAADAIGDFLAGLRSGTGHPSPPLAPATSGPLRSHEVATGVGERD